MKNEFKLVAILAVVLVGLAAFSVALAEPSDADSGDIKAGSPTASDFKDNSNGTVKINVTNNSGDTQYLVKVVVYENDKQIASGSYETLDIQKQTTLSVSFKLGKGTHTVGVAVLYKNSPDGGESSTDIQFLSIDSQKTIWSGQLPYVALIIVALIIAAMIFIWIRGRPKSQPAVTFSDLEEGKTVEAPAPAAATKKKYSSESSEDSGPVKYKSFRRK